jgi:hypothetical protein
MKLTYSALVLPLLVFTYAKAAPLASTVTPDNRVASIYVSQDFINEQIEAHSKSSQSALIQSLKVVLDPNHNQIFLRGKIQIPTEELRAINLDPKLGTFVFQLTIKPEATRKGHLILDFPLDQTFFYPSGSADPQQDRVIVPVQMLSLALASARGYLAALSGDFSGFDRRAHKLEALIKALDTAISHEKNSDARDALQDQKESLRLQLEAVPIERKQLHALSKEFENVLGFTGEKELNINNELGARKNALILKIKLSQLAPYLNGVDLGGVRVLLDSKDGDGENYLAVDLNSPLAAPLPPKSTKPPAAREKMKIAPALIMRLNQSLFESSEVLDAEKKEMGSNLRNMAIHLKDDGLHVSGEWHKLFLTIPFDTIVDFVTTGIDVFEVRVRELDVAGIDFEFMTKYVLEIMKKRLDTTLRGSCSFKYVGEEKDHSRALEVTVNPKALVPAFPDLHLVNVDVRDQEFLLKIGHQSAR